MNIIVLLNICLSKCYFPWPWQRNTSYFGKKEMTNTIQVDPICLMDAWGIVLDKLPTERIQKRQQSTKQFQDTEYRFTRVRSTMDVKESAHPICIPNQENKKVWLYIKSAFNNVWLLVVLADKGKINCPDKQFIRWLKVFSTITRYNF